MGMTEREGGVSGAPNAGANPGVGARVPEGGVASGDGEDTATGGATVPADGGDTASPVGAIGCCREANGGVRCRPGSGALVSGARAPATNGCAAPDGEGGQDGAATEADPVADPALASTGFTPAGVDPMGAAGWRAPGAGDMSSPHCTAAPTGIRPPQTEQRARIDTLVILAGSSLKTDRHSGQETFIENAGLEESEARDGRHPASTAPTDGRSKTPSPEATWRKPSSPSPARLPGLLRQSPADHS